MDVNNKLFFYGSVIIITSIMYTQSEKELVWEIIMHFPLFQSLQMNDVCAVSFVSASWVPLCSLLHLPLSVMEGHRFQYLLMATNIGGSHAYIRDAERPEERTFDSVSHLDKIP